MTITESTLTADEQRVDDLVTELLEAHPPATTEPAAFLGAQFDAGLERGRAGHPVSRREWGPRRSLQGAAGPVVGRVQARKR